MRPFLSGKHALKYYFQAVEKDPGSASAQSNLAGALAETGRSAEAAEHCRAALEADPDLADAQNILGILLAKSGNLDEAIGHLERAVAHVPDSLEFNLGRVLAARGRFEDAVPQFEQATQLSGGQNANVLEMLAAMYSETKRFAEASQAARRALDLAISNNDGRLAQVLRARIAEYEAQAEKP